MLSEIFAPIVKTYQKHGWTLRRVLLSGEAEREDLTAALPSFPQVEISTAEINALWFSRLANNRETWEIRTLDNSPFALCASFDAATPETEREKIRRQLQQKIENRAS